MGGVRTCCSLVVVGFEPLPRFKICRQTIQTNCEIIIRFLHKVWYEKKNYIFTKLIPLKKLYTTLFIHKVGEEEEGGGGGGRKGVDVGGWGRWGEESEVDVSCHFATQEGQPCQKCNTSIFN